MMRLIWSAMTCAALVLVASPALSSSIHCAVAKGLAVDADGAPNSYRVDGRGLSYTCDGVFAIIDGVAHTQLNDKEHWQELCREHWRHAIDTGDFSQVKIVGFLTDDQGRPVVQGVGDPLPGEGYVTTTQLTVPNTPPTAQRHFVDANEIPYLVVSRSYAKAHKLRLADVIAVYRPRTNRLAFGVYGDCCSLGEASVRLHKDLGNDPIVLEQGGVARAKRGIEDAVVFVALPGAHTQPTLDAAAWRREIASKGQTSLGALGGIDALRRCARGP